MDEWASRFKRGMHAMYRSFIVWDNDFILTLLCLNLIINIGTVCFYCTPLPSLKVSSLVGWYSQRLWETKEADNHTEEFKLSPGDCDTALKFYLMAWKHVAYFLILVWHVLVVFWFVMQYWIGLEQRSGHRKNQVGADVFFSKLANQLVVYGSFLLVRQPFNLLKRLFCTCRWDVAVEWCITTFPGPTESRGAITSSGSTVQTSLSSCTVGSLCV